MFAVNTATFLLFALVLIGWRRPIEEAAHTPERFIPALRAGGRYIRFSPVVRRILFRLALSLFRPRQFGHCYRWWQATGWEWGLQGPDCCLAPWVVARSLGRIPCPDFARGCREQQNDPFGERGLRHSDGGTSPSAESCRRLPCAYSRRSRLGRGNRKRERIGAVIPPRLGTRSAAWLGIK